MRGRRLAYTASICEKKCWRSHCLRKEPIRCVRSVRIIGHVRLQAGRSKSFLRVFQNLCWFESQTRMTRKPDVTFLPCHHFSVVIRGMDKFSIFGWVLTTQKRSIISKLNLKYKILTRREMYPLFQTLGRKGCIVLPFILAVAASICVALLSHSNFKFRHIQIVTKK